MALRSFVLATIVLFSYSVAAAAQDVVPQDFRSGARVHFGPVYLNPLFELKELGVDTNVFNASEDPKSDFTTTVAPAFQVWLPFGRRVVMSGTGGANLVYYHTYTNERSVSGNYAVRADVALHRMTLFAADSLLNTRDRPSFEVDIRPRHTEENVRAGLVFSLHKKMFLELSGSQSRLRYDTSEVFLGTNLGGSLDHDTKTVGVTASYRLTPLTTLLLRSEVLQDRFTISTIRDGDSIRVVPGVTFSTRALITGSASFGVRQFRARTRGVPDYTGAVGFASLSYTLRGATTVGVSADRDLNYSFEPLQPYYILNGAGVTVRRQLVGSFDVTFGMQRYSYVYRHLVLPIGVSASADRQDVTTNYSGDLGYRLNRKARVAFGVAYWRRSSNEDVFRDYGAIRFRTTVAYSF